MLGMEVLAQRGHECDLLCTCATCEQCAEGSPYHRGDPAECRGPGAAEYAELRAFGEDGKLFLGVRERSA